jgi:hypothetical protein
MNHNSSLPAWLAMAVILVGLGSLLLLGIQPIAQPAGANEVVANQPTGTNVFAVAQNSADASPLAPPNNLTPFATETLVATPTPVPPLVLPSVNVPEGGQVYLLQPTAAEAVGWAKAQDEAVNHFGDYNIYAGVFGGQQHVGAMQFDLATIPLGSPIIYADLTLTGLDGQWLAPDGRWRAEVLASWIDDDWLNRNFHWLSRADSGVASLDNEVSSADIGQGRFNTFSLPPAGIAELQARLFKSKIAFRLVGPSSGTDNLFAWDSGFGARSTGRAPVLRIVTSGPAPAEPPPSPTPYYIVITLTPTDDNSILMQAAARLTATALATPGEVAGTPEPTATTTPLPPNWATPVIVTNTPVPENQATAVWEAQIATAQAIVRGTATATPPNVWTATATPLPPPPTATPMIVFFEGLTPTATPTYTPVALPAILSNKLLFFTDRFQGSSLFGGDSLMVMNPDGSNVAVWTGGADDWVYQRAQQNRDISPDGRFRVIVSSEQVNNSQLWIVDLSNGARRQLTNFKQIAYDAVWSPVDNRIIFVSPESGNDEIYVINMDGTGLTQLTRNEWEWDKYPAWSPDGQQIVFWSNRDTRRKQIWIMNADGSNARNLSNNEFNDWEPVWVR